MNALKPFIGFTFALIALVGVFAYDLRKAQLAERHARAEASFCEEHSGSVDDYYSPPSWDTMAFAVSPVLILLLFSMSLHWFVTSLRRRFTFDLQVGDTQYAIGALSGGEVVLHEHRLSVPGANVLVWRAATKTTENVLGEVTLERGDVAVVHDGRAGDALAKAVSKALTAGTGVLELTADFPPGTGAVVVRGD